MPHLIGQTVLQYKIVEKLGEGGMGVVYKAEDTRLRRTVALKFLPHDVESHETERARFLQEAQAAALLNHPNICTVYDIQEHEGEQFIVMEYVDGKTLRQIVPIKNMQTAIDYAMQIGEALQEAHSKGIVHRDIKTDNIMVNSKNQIKVMDFGLAKLRGSVRLTKSRSTVGTLAYMSPEQIQGADADAQSDIFSFGVVLYEMLTGELPFKGVHEAAIVYSIVNEEPAPAEQSRPDISPGLSNVLAKALQKDPRHRFQNSTDLLDELRRTTPPAVQSAHESPGSWTGSGPFTRVPSAAKVKTRRWIVPAGASILVIAFVAGIMFVSREHRSREINPNMSFRTIDVPFTNVELPGLSPDGNWVSFGAKDANGKWDLYVMNLSGGDPRRITFDSSAYAGYSDFSPDGSQILYGVMNSESRRFEQYKVYVLGGGTQLLTARGGRARWRPDGKRIGYLTGGGWFFSEAESARVEFRSINPDGSDDQLEFADSLSNPLFFDSWFAWAPDGGSVAWNRVFDPEHQDIIVRDLTTGSEHQITSDRANIGAISWTRSGNIVFSSNRGRNFNLWVIPSSGGEARQLTYGNGPDLGVQISTDESRLLCLQRESRGHIWIANTTKGTAREMTFEDKLVNSPVLSPDARRIAFVLAEPTPLVITRRSHLFICSRDGEAREQITRGEEVVSSPLWSPDGRWIAYGKRSSSEQEDATKACILSAANPQNQKTLGIGFPQAWIDTVAFVSSVLTKSWITFVNGEPQRPFNVDSTYLFQMSDRGFTYLDTRAGREGSWFVPELLLKVFDKPEIIRAVSVKYEKYPKSLLNASRSTQDARHIIYMDEKSHEMMRFIFPVGRIERIGGSYPVLSDLGSGSGLGYDQKELVYSSGDTRGKLVLIENPFR